MEYKIIAEELVKNGFTIDSFGCPEKTIGNIHIIFSEHPIYHVVMFSRESENGRTLHIPADIKLPKKCDTDDVIYVIDSLVQGMENDEIVFEIFKRLNPEEASEKAVNNTTDKRNNKIKFEITQNIGILSEGAKGWNKEFNLISWNGRDPKFDIREWSPEHDKMGKGVTLTKEEIVALRDLLNGLEL